MYKNRFALASCLVLTSWSAGTYAFQVGIDSLSVSGTNAGGAVSFIDGFTDGAPPPCGPAGCATQPALYRVFSANPLSAESGGMLPLDSANGILGTNAAGGRRLTQSVQIAGSQSQLLKSGGDISMDAVFTLPTLSGPGNQGYGIRFADVPVGAGLVFPQEVLELNVQWWTGGGADPAGWYIRYLVQDYVAKTIVTIAADLVSIPTGADEISLSLDRTAGNDLFAASYAFVTGGSVGTRTSLGSAEGFRYQNYVRPLFQTFESVPAPGTLLLVSGAFVALLASRRRRSGASVAAGGAD
jgi:hypothetical protein